MNNIPCDSLGSDRYSLWKDQGSIRPLTPPLPFKVSAQTQIGLIRCFPGHTSQENTEPITGSDEIFIASG